MNIGVWFPAVRTGTGTDTFTEYLVKELVKRGVRAAIDWLPLQAEFMPWVVKVPAPPVWANIVHVNTWLSPRFIPRHLKVVATCHLCVHDPCLLPYKSFMQRAYHRKYIKAREKRVLGLADQVTAVSRYTADRVMETFDRNDVVVVPNWVEAKQSLDQRQIHHPFRILFSGSITPRKGADLLPAIMRQLGPGYQLYYTGSREDFKETVLPENMIPLGRLTHEKMLVTYREVDALLFPSRLEGLSMVLLEAMASELPVIVSDIGPNLELVEDKETGLVCQRDNVNSFVSAIKKLNSDKQLYRNISEKSLSLVNKYFSPDMACKKYIDIYSAVLN